MDKKSFYFLMGVAIVVVFILARFFISRQPAKPPAVSITKPVPVAEKPHVVEKEIPKYEFQKGMSYVAWTKHGYNNVHSVKAMEQMKSIGIEWVCLISTWFQDRINSTIIYKLRGDNALCIPLRIIGSHNIWLIWSANINNQQTIFPIRHIGIKAIL